MKWCKVFRLCVSFFLVQITSAIPITQKQDIPSIQKQDIPSNHKQDIPASSLGTESPSPAEPAPQTLPFPPHAVRSSSPKLDPSELYLKSKALMDSKREFSFHLGFSDVSIQMKKLIFRCDLQLSTQKTWTCLSRGTRRLDLASECWVEKGRISRWVFTWPGMLFKVSSIFLDHFLLVCHWVLQTFNQ